METKRILAIDPGNIESGYCIVDVESRKPLLFGKCKNTDIWPILENQGNITFQEAVIEMVASYGMPVGASIFETCVWIGRFAQALEDDPRGKIPVTFLKRTEVKSNICHSPKATDATIRQALIDRFAPDAQNYGKGTKDNPGFFYGFKADIWQAYALGVTYIDRGMVINW